MKFQNPVSWEMTAVGTGAAVAAAVLTTLAAAKYIKNGTPKAVPSKWIKVGEVKSIYIYPIKSAKGVSVSDAIITNLGLKG